MQGIIDRHLAGTIRRRLQNNPAVAILGPRQCGKTTLAGQLVKKNQSVYLDLENPSDLAKLADNSNLRHQFIPSHGRRLPRCPLRAWNLRASPAPGRGLSPTVDA